MVSTILFPASYFSINRVDEGLIKEYEAVVKTGLFDIILFDYDKFVEDNKLALNKKINEKINCIYRGYMFNEMQYKSFYEKLKNENIILITTPEKYSKVHIFPNVYNDIKENTPKILTYLFDEKIDVEEIKKHFDKFIVKDFVKSVKGTSFPKFFDSSITQEKFDEQMKIFYKYRGKLLTGGICIKEYVELKKYNEKTNEYRVFYANGNILSIERNSGQSEFTKKIPEKFICMYKNLDILYYTIDYGELEDGTFMILETGDGGVSGLSDFQNYDEYFVKTENEYKADIEVKFIDEEDKKTECHLCACSDCPAAFDCGCPAGANCKEGEIRDINCSCCSKSHNNGDNDNFKKYCDSKVHAVEFIIEDNNFDGVIDYRNNARLERKKINFRRSLKMWNKVRTYIDSDYREDEELYGKEMLHPHRYWKWTAWCSRTIEYGLWGVIDYFNMYDKNAVYWNWYRQMQTWRAMRKEGDLMPHQHFGLYIFYIRKFIYDNKEKIKQCDKLQSILDEIQKESSIISHWNSNTHFLNQMF